MRHCFAVLVLLTVSRLAFPQGFGTIVGTVTGPSGGLIIVRQNHGDRIGNRILARGRHEDHRRVRYSSAPACFLPAYRRGSRIYFAETDVSQTGLNMDRGMVTGTPPGDNHPCPSAPCVNWLNPNSFALPAAGTVGNVGKGAIVGPGLFNWDMGAFKNIRFSERWRAQLTREFLNTLNHSNFANSNFNYPNNSVNGASFGTITAAGDPRILQLALKVTF